jgi:TFIIF-interacting CTD phosphatase-like protein
MVFIKDLSRIGRPLNKTIIVDNVAENFSLQPDNGIFIKSWFDDKSDTALLELDETLVHYYEVNGEGSFRIRPGCEKFLKEMSEMYEVVIFTAAMQDYADWVLDSIDKPKYISYRLYR